MIFIFPKFVDSIRGQWEREFAQPLTRSPLAIQPLSTTSVFTPDHSIDVDIEIISLTNLPKGY